jgi:hypothetical protein
MRDFARGKIIMPSQDTRWLCQFGCAFDRRLLRPMRSGLLNVVRPIWSRTFAADLAAFAAARTDSAVWHRSDHILGVPLTEQAGQRLALGGRASILGPHDQRQVPWFEHFGRRPDRGLGLHEGTVGHGCAGQ